MVKYAEEDEKKEQGPKTNAIGGGEAKVKMEADKHDNNSKRKQRKKSRSSKQASHGAAKRKLKEPKRPTHKEKNIMKTMSRMNWNECWENGDIYGRNMARRTRTHKRDKQHARRRGRK